MTEIGQRTSDAIVSSAGVLASQANDHIHHFGAGTRPAWIRATRRDIELLSDELSKPAQNRLRSGHNWNLLETLSVKTFANLSECGSLIIA
jgi:hypothetical protein